MLGLERKSMLFENITRLVEYGIHNDLLEKEDRIYCINAY